MIITDRLTDKTVHCYSWKHPTVMKNPSHLAVSYFHSIMLNLEKILFTIRWTQRGVHTDLKNQIQLQHNIILLIRYITDPGLLFYLHTDKTVSLSVAWLIGFRAVSVELHVQTKTQPFCHLDLVSPLCHNILKSSHTVKILDKCNFISIVSSYLSGRSFPVNVGNFTSSHEPLSSGSAGFCSGPTSVYLIPLGHLIRTFKGASYYCYANVIHSYVSFKPNNLYKQIQSINPWMADNFLKLNTDKTEVLVSAPSAPSRMIENLDLPPFAVEPSLCNLDVFVTSIWVWTNMLIIWFCCQFHQLRNISKIRPVGTSLYREIIIHAFIQQGNTSGG